MTNKGSIIVIDGLDGSGKTTQFEIIKNTLSEQNMTVKAISFPDYEQPSSTLVKMYLKGEFSKKPEDINAYAASSFYAVDRYASFKLFWEENYNNGELILASRYVSSNAIHQMVKLEKALWDDYLKWLEEYEYEKLGIPRPNIVIFLDMPVSISQKLMLDRYLGDQSKKDIHEANVSYLEECRSSALYAAKKLGWIIIECSKNNQPKSVNEISDDIMNTINSFLGKER